MSDVDRRPTAITLKSLLGLIWTPSALGLVALPGSLRNGPDLYGVIASVIVVVGCAVSVIGLVWGMRRNQAAGLNVEALGLTGVFLGCGMYAFALATVPRFSDAILAFGVCVALVGFSGVQRWLIRRHLKRQRLAHLGAGDES